MELRDFLVTPIVLILIYWVAYLLRPYVSDEVNRVYYFPALTLKILGAVALGVVYQFYYGGGDTFMYHTYGSRIVWNVFLDSPSAGLKLLLADSSNPRDIYQYASQIYLFRDPSSYAIIKMASVFDLLTFSTYTATASLFAVLSFIGSWQFFLTFYKQFPHLHGKLAIAAFFIPSVFFWGSGLMKDSVTLACLGIATYQFYNLFIAGKYRLSHLLLLLISLYLIFAVRKFILQAYIPAILLWIGAAKVHHIRSVVVRVMLVPFVAAILVVSGYYSVVKIGEDDERYAVSKMAKTARKTAYDIRFWTGRNAGSGYTLDVKDWTPVGMIQAAPSAVNVALFRPYLWEVKNPLMLISSLESAFLFVFTLFVLGTNFGGIYKRLQEHNVLFCLLFSLVLAFAVGISTFNFGTLVRYRIPMLPFFVLLLIMLSDRLKKPAAATELTL